MVGSPPPLVLGLDLHGTLLEPGEKIRSGLVAPISGTLARLKGRVESYICTGNDLDFVRRKVPEAIRAETPGCVLETGCSLSLDGNTEVVLTSPEERQTIAALEALLRQQNFPQLNYFAHRLTTISMFCDHPRDFYAQVHEFVQGTPFFDLVHITYSSVAVDILPRGYNKARGLRTVAQGRPAIGVADSMNDLDLLAEADYAFAPSNLAPEVIPLLAKRGRKVKALRELSRLTPDTVGIAAGRETEGVLEILLFLHRSLASAEAAGA